MGIFTAYSANRYHAGQSEKMSAHIDSGDTKFGMTTMCVFRDGSFGGAFLTFPRYRIAIDAPDNSVVIADSRQVHGVTPITGNGQRFSCVAYCDNGLATMGVAGKSERKIGRFACNTHCCQSIITIRNATKSLSITCNWCHSMYLATICNYN
jgi:hypothetical protein